MGLGYPLPISKTQNVFSILGFVTAICIGNFNFLDALSISTSDFCRCDTTKGLSTRVSFETMCTSLVNLLGEISNNAVKILCATRVLSLPPEKPIIQGKFCFSDKSSSRISNINLSNNSLISVIILSSFQDVFFL